MYRIETFLRPKLARAWIPVAIAAVCLSPLVMALYFRFVAPPTASEVAGNILVPTRFPYRHMQQLNGQVMADPVLSDYWMVVHVESGDCGIACRKALYLSRQARTAQGRHSERIQRIWVISDKQQPAAELLAQHPDLQVVYWLDRSVTPSVQASPVITAPGIYLVDRRGFLVFRYDVGVDPGRFIWELGKLVQF